VHARNDSSFPPGYGWKREDDHAAAELKRDSEVEQVQARNASLFPGYPWTRDDSTTSSPLAALKREPEPAPAPVTGKVDKRGNPVAADVADA